MPKIIQDKDVSKQLYYELTPERLAILDLIAYTEGTDREIGKTKKGYNILFGFDLFEPGEDHPRIPIEFGDTFTTASGRYQFLDVTWDYVQKRLRNTDFEPFPSFEPTYQDQAALFLIDGKRNAIEAVYDRSLTGFLERCSWEWASLPDPETNKSRYKQPSIDIAKLTPILSL